MALVGGREIHPINVRVGGFYRAPREARAGAARAEQLEARPRDRASRPSRWVAGLDFPDFERDYELVALCAARRVPDRARPASSRTAASTSAPREYDEHFVEEHVPHSNALHSRMRERGAYLVGPLARYALNCERLSPLAREAARRGRARDRDAATRSGASSCARVEILYALDEALRLIAELRAARPARGRGRAARRESATAGPRRRAGMLYHRYELDDDGTILDAKIVPPTSQNQRDDRGGPARVRRALAATCPTTSCRCAASRRSATTTPASPARRTS